MYVRHWAFVIVLSLCQLNLAGQETQQKRIADFLNQEELSKGFSGTVLIAKGDEILFEGAYGYSDSSSGQKNELTTRYSLASLGKLFTMVAVLQLIEQGKLSLDDKLTRYVKGFKDKRANQITIQQLLRHRAGWQHYWNHPEYLKSRLETDSIVDYMRFIKEMPLGFNPGSRSQYSNIGYVVLGAVIEEITQEDYYNHIQKRIFQPLGMDRSDYAAYRKLSREYARHGGDGARKNLLDMTAVRGTADGGGYSTTRNLYDLSKALFADKLLTEESKALIVNGFRSDELQKGWMVRIAGGFPGISTVFGHYSSDRLTVIILSNSTNYAVPNLMDELVRKVLD